ncbi:D-amino-acid transaminase [Candidatus Endowatersipora endosymbiont of Watersipora subatra]|uniref:D-amino-acid transaminase n=1 Tax=Candidatus Endowatersipora endosymbiont of Watersipora subatra TaxID=3077946 RepID=UPI00312C97DD
MRTVYLNGNYVLENEASISIFDRGFLFSDAVYEVTAVVNRKLLDFVEHTRRLRRSLNELSLPLAMTNDELLDVHHNLVEINSVDQGIVYLQVTRGNSGDRDFLFPKTDIPETVLVFTQKRQILHTAIEKKGLKIISLDDLRWRRNDIKTVQLLYPSMAKMEAVKRGADDVWLVWEGFVTEGASSNAHIVKNNCTITRNLSNDILQGITRESILECARLLEIEVEERPFTLAEAYAADEAFTTSASGFINPVIEIDGHNIGNGRPGPVSKKLRTTYLKKMMKSSL